MRLIVSCLEKISESDLTQSKFLGVWCFKGREYEFQEWEKLDFLDAPYSDIEQIKNAENTILLSSKIIQNDLVNMLNKYHGINKPSAFWSPIITSWTMTGLMLIHSHYARLMKNLEKGVWSVCLINDKVRPTIETTADLTRLAQKDDYFNYWIVSRLIEKLQRKNIKISYIHEEFNTGANNESHNSITLIRRFISVVSYFVELYGLKIKGVVFYDLKGINLLDRIYLTIRSKKNKKKLNLTDNKICHNIDQKTDEFEIFDTLDNDFSRLAKDILFQLIPKEFFSSSIKGQGLPLAERTILGPVQFYDLTAQVAVGNSLIANKNKLVGVQHGAAYGTYKVYPIVSEIEYKHCHMFITWGWESHSSYKLNSYPLPSPYLSKYYNSHVKKNNEFIIMLSPNFYYNDFRLGCILKKNHVIKRTENIIDLLYVLEKEIVKTTFFRPFFSVDNQYPQLQVLINSFPNIGIIKGSAIDERLKKCRLVLTDLPSTTFFLAMAMNIPGIYYWDQKAFPESEQSVEYFNILRQNGILFDDYLSAAIMINSVWNDIDEWWMSDQVQHARNIFLNKYALCSKNWRKEWLEFINDL